MEKTDFMKKAEKLLKEYSGDAGFSIRSADGKEEYSYQKNKSFSAASVVKIFVLGTLLSQVEEGKTSLETMLCLKEKEKAGGSGILLDMSEGLQLSVKDTAMLMIIMSDNTATNMLIDLNGGVDAIGEHLKKHGIVSSRVNRKIDDDEAVVSTCNFGDATPEELQKYLFLIENDKVFSREGKALFFDMLSRQHYKDLFSRFMPLADYYETQENGLVKVANKTGFMQGIRTDAGRIETEDGKIYLYAVMTGNCRDITFSPDGECNLFPALLGKAFYETVIKVKEG